MSEKELESSESLTREELQRRMEQVELSAPWSEKCSQYLELKDLSDSIVNGFVTERTRVHELYIREQEKTKRLGLVLSFILIISAAAMILFAPEGRETLSYWIGAALLIFAAGSAGYKRVWGKTKNISLGADQDRNELLK